MHFYDLVAQKSKIDAGADEDQAVGTTEMLIKTESVNTLIHTVAERIVTTAVFRKHPDGENN